MKAVTLRAYIDDKYNRNISLFALMYGVSRQAVHQWVKRGAIWLEHEDKELTGVYLLNGKREGGK